MRSRRTAPHALVFPFPVPKLLQVTCALALLSVPIGAGRAQAVSTAPSATASGDDFEITVVYTDDVGIDTSTLGDNDIYVQFAEGPQSVTFEGYTGGGTSVTATYLLNFQACTSNPERTIVMNADEVFDTEASPQAVPSGTIGSYTGGVCVECQQDPPYCPPDVHLSPGESTDPSHTGIATGSIAVCSPAGPLDYFDTPAAANCSGLAGITRTWYDGSPSFVVCVQHIDFVDATDPEIVDAAASPAALWPPSHQMVDVTIDYTASDAGGGPVTTELSVSSNEPVNGTGDGDQSPDWIVLDEHHVSLRAERAGKGSGRIYTVTITATDGCGNTATASVNVAVAHNATPNGAGATAVLASGVQLSQGRPNPFRTSTELQYALPEQARVEMGLYSILGQRVQTLVDGIEDAGFRTVRVDARGLQPGIYFVRLRATSVTDPQQTFTQTRMLQLVR